MYDANETERSQRRIAAAAAARLRDLPESKQPMAREESKAWYRDAEPSTTQQARVGRNAILVTQTQEITASYTGPTGKGAVIGTLGELEKFASTLRGLGAHGDDIVTCYLSAGGDYGAAHTLSVTFPMRDIYPR